MSEGRDGDNDEKIRTDLWRKKSGQIINIAHAYPFNIYSFALFVLFTTYNNT